METCGLVVSPNPRAALKVPCGAAAQAEIEIFPGRLAYEGREGIQVEIWTVAGKPSHPDPHSAAGVFRRRSGGPDRGARVQRFFGAGGAPFPGK